MYEALEKALSYAAFTIKSGDIVVRDGEIVATPLGNTYWVDANVPEDLEKEVYKEIEEDFNKYYTVSLRNYPVQDAYLPTGKPIATKGKWC